MKNILVLISGLTLLLWASLAFAGWQEDYRQALSRKDFFAAVRIAEGEAAQGNAEAQNCLGLLYLNGQGVTQNEVEGLTLLMVAAKNGSAAAGQHTEFLKKRMKPEHIDKASEAARNHRWKRGR